MTHTLVDSEHRNLFLLWSAEKYKRFFFVENLAMVTMYTSASASMHFFSYQGAFFLAGSGVYRFSQRGGPYLLKNFWCKGGLVAGVVLGANCVG